MASRYQVVITPDAQDGIQKIIDYLSKSYRIIYTVDKNAIQVIVVDVDYGPRSQKRVIKKFS